MSLNELITINARKLDGEIHRSWKAELIEETEDLYVFLGIFDFEIAHPKLGVIRRETKSYEYYWKNGWFNVFRFHEPEGDFRNYYCNINQPPVLENGILNYVDLDIDVLIWKDFSYEILDIDEFEENIEKYKYPESLQKQAHKSLKDLLKIIEQKEFPFGDEDLKY